MPNPREQPFEATRHDALMSECGVRTTIDLPERLYKEVEDIARDTGRTFSETVASLIRRGLASAEKTALSVDTRTGLPVVSVGVALTSEDVRSLEDE